MPLQSGSSTARGDFEMMTVSNTAAKRFLCRQGQGDARRPIPPLALFKLCENDQAGAEVKPLSSVVTNSGC